MTTGTSELRLYHIEASGLQMLGIMSAVWARNDEHARQLAALQFEERNGLEPLLPLSERMAQLHITACPIDQEAQ